MAGQPYTNAGAVVSISTTPQNDDLAGTSPGFAGLNYTPISNVGNIGPYGYTTNMVSYPVLDRAIALKAKGGTDGGSWTLQFADKPGDPGQVACEAAADPNSQDNYVFRIQYANGGVHYIRGPLGGPSTPGGNNEAFVVFDYSLGVNEVHRVPPPTSP